MWARAYTAVYITLLGLYGESNGQVTMLVLIPMSILLHVVLFTTPFLALQKRT